MYINYDNQKLFIEWCNRGSDCFETFCDKKHKENRDEPCINCLSKLEDDRHLRKNHKTANIKGGVFLVLFKEEGEGDL